MTAKEQTDKRVQWVWKEAQRNNEIISMFTAKQIVKSETLLVISILTQCHNFVPTAEITRQILIHEEVLTELNKM